MPHHLPLQDQYFDGDCRLNRKRSLESLQFNPKLEFYYE